VKNLRGLQVIVVVLVILAASAFRSCGNCVRRALSLLLPKHLPEASHMTLHTRLVLRMTAILLLGGTRAIYLCQFVGHTGPAPSLWRAFFSTRQSRARRAQHRGRGRVPDPGGARPHGPHVSSAAAPGHGGRREDDDRGAALLNLWTIVREKREIQVAGVGDQRTANQAFVRSSLSRSSGCAGRLRPHCDRARLRFCGPALRGRQRLPHRGLSRGGDAGAIRYRQADPRLHHVSCGRIGLIVIASALQHKTLDTVTASPRRRSPHVIFRERSPS
jgi:hypothetical protein